MLTFSKMFNYAIIQLSNSLLTLTGNKNVETAYLRARQTKSHSCCMMTCRRDFSFFLGSGFWLSTSLTLYSSVNCLWQTEHWLQVPVRRHLPSRKTKAPPGRTTTLKACPVEYGPLLLTKASWLRPTNFRWRQNAESRHSRLFFPVTGRRWLMVRTTSFRLATLPPNTLPDSPSNTAHKQLLSKRQFWDAWHNMKHVLWEANPGPPEIGF